MRRIWKEWIDEEDAFLQAQYTELSLKKLSEILDRPIEDIHYRVRQLGIRKKRLWTPSEDKILRELYPTTLMNEIIQKLGRDRMSIYNRVAKLGLKRSPETRSRIQGELLRKYVRLWTLEEDKKLIELFHQKLSITEIARLLNRTYGAVQHRLTLLGYPIGNRRVSIGKKGEKMARAFIIKQGWTILERGNHTSPYDFIIQKDGVKIVINVKYGHSAGIKATNLDTLLEFSPNIAILYITNDEKYYLMKVERLS